MTLAGGLLAVIGVALLVIVVGLFRPACDQDERFSSDRKQPRNGGGK